jgi:HAD superfamily hydrolase (TIGR01509 family)
MQVFREVSSEYGKHPSDQELAAHLGDWEMPRDLGITDTEGFFKKSIALARPRLLEVELYDGALELLKALKASGHKIALLSSSVRSVLETGLAHNGLTDIFDVVLAAEDVTEHKPHPEVILKGLAALDADPHRAVMIGDSDKDLLAARNAGVDSVLFYPPEHKILYDLGQLRALGPAHVVGSFAELQRFFGV